MIWSGCASNSTRGAGTVRGTPAWAALEQAVIGKTTNFLLHSVLHSELQ